MTHLFITEKINKGEINVKHCEMTDIIANYYMEALQGKLFVKMWNMILRIEDVDNKCYIKRAKMESVKQK